MDRAALRARLRRHRTLLVIAAVLVLAAAAVIAGVVTASPSVRTHSQFVAGTPEGRTPVRLDTTLYLPATTPAPAVLLTQGFGGDKTDLAGEARTFAQHGYVVLTYTARGFGDSGGKIHFAAPDYEIHDATLLVDWLAARPEVRKVGGRPQIAAAGSSYGGGISLLLAAADPRVQAVAADITWNDLQHAFFPNAAGDAPGVFKRLWLGALFGNGFSGTSSALGAQASPQPSGASTGTSGDPPSDSTGARDSVSCGRFAADVCAAYQASARTGRPTPALQRIMTAASPSHVLRRIRVPTLLTQGEQDSLFPLSEADATARGIAAHGTPVRVAWRPGGHDDESIGTGTATADAISWFHQVFHGGVHGRQPFQFAEQAGVVSAETGDASQQVLQANGYPGIDGTRPQSRTVRVSGPTQPIASPAGGAPAQVTSIPGLGGLLDQAGSFVSLPSAPGQTAAFSSARLSNAVHIVGAPTVRLQVTSAAGGTVQLFAALQDLASDGTSTLPSQLVAPLRLTGLQAGVPRTVTVRLPPVVRNVLAGHRLVLTVSSTDFAYANLTKPQTYTVGLVGGSAAVRVPTVAGTPIDAGHPVTWLIVGLAVCVLAVLLVATVLIRRRRVLQDDPDLADVPVSVEGLVKEYAGGYRAVDGVTFRVERGQVVGLLGPNGAGKTTVLRVLVGLITETSGAVHVFGKPVVPGAPVLARLGAFIEGPGFLPHLTGRENLRLFWAASGRPDDEAEFATALDIAGLGGSIDRRVKNYSHGMRQRLGIAQAMLGLPEVLVLDEPTNGLDPPQIAEMREVLRQYAATGRTVIVSSHLLAEVEQTCTHVVVMHRGQLVAAGSVADVAGSGAQQLAVDDPDEARRVLATAGIAAQPVPARRALEDVFLDLIGEGQ